MNKLLPRTFSVTLILALMMNMLSMASPALADNIPQSLPFSQIWSNTGLITTNDNWSGVPGIQGFLGQDITTSTGTDPQTLLGVSGVANDLDVIANQTNTGITNGGVVEFEITDPVIAMQGSGTADAPHIILYLNTTGQTNITISYNLRDIDATTDNAVQPVALQYRVGSSGNFTNIPAGFVADATTGPSLATLITPVSVLLPAAVENQSEVQLRIMTTNAVGNDEWVGIDDISVTASVVDTAPSVTTTSPADGATSVAVNTNIDVTFSEAVNASGSSFGLSCATSGVHSYAVSSGPTTFTLDPDTDFANNELCTVTVFAAQVTDQDANDPPDNMAADYVFSFTTISAVDTAPSVSSTTPANGATNVAVNTNADVTFSEAVNASGSSFGISCGTSGAHSYAVSGGPTTFTLNPDTDFANSESCTITVVAAQITDQDSNDPPDNMAADYVFNFDTVSAPVAASLVVNEIDYDQPGTDTTEFIEIKNTSASAVNLDTYTLVFINGSGGATYDTIDLPNVSLAAGDYYVVCANTATVVNCDLDDGPDTNFIQNGAPDAVALVQGATVIDTVSYEGDTIAPYTEGSGVGLIDDGVVANQGISRLPDGVDTNQNNVDFSTRCITPGETNSSGTSGCVVDAPPTVASTNPLNGATGVSVTSNIDVNFSEAVTVTGSWFSISCVNSGVHTATVSGGPQNYTLDPNVNFGFSESCSVTIVAANVADQDGTPHNMTADYNFSFATGAQPFVCGDPATYIHDVQGSGLASPLVGNVVTVEGVVVGSFQGTNQFGGFHVQEEDADADANPATSEGIFVFNSSNTPAVGNTVRIQATVAEFNNLTELTSVGNFLNCSSGNVVTPATVTLPVTSVNDFEKYEGMLVILSQPLVISEYFNYERFGELVLALPLPGESRAFTPTAIDEPGGPALARALANSLRRITLDDGFGNQNPISLRHPNGSPFALNNTFRGGDTVQNVTGVMDFSFGLYRIQPTAPAVYTSVNPRSIAPEAVGGRLQIAAMNTLNFFLTLDEPSGPLDNKCGPLQSVECRGADSDQPLEFTRQRDKLLAALAGLNADVIGLNELENTAGVDPLGDPTNGIVAGLNNILGAGTYAYINTGTIGTDAIRVGLIYKPAEVVPVGGFQVLDSSDDPRFIDTKSRPALAQTFEEVATGARFTVVVNHFKSKGSACNDVGDPDAGDGQGNCNGTRVLAAQALVDWLATDPTGSGDPDFIIMGDLNSYAQEDPIDAIKAGSDDTAGTSDDFTNLIYQYQGTYAYSYTFDGQAGYLDHALANTSLAAQVIGAADWHINSDEPDLFDYDTSFKPLEQEAIYEPNAYRSSDHDPVIIGLNLNASPTVDAGGPYAALEGGTVLITATGFDPLGDSLTYEWDLDNNGSFETAGQSVNFVVGSLDGPNGFVVNVKVTDPGTLFAVASATVNVANLAPTAVLSAPAVVNEGVSFVASFSGAFDPSSADTLAGFHYAFDCNGGSLASATYATSGTSNSVNCTFPSHGLYTVRGKIMDKDNGSNEYTVLVLAKNVTTILDNFNRANGAIGSNWKGSTGTNIYRIDSNRVDVRGNGPIYWKNIFGVNQEVSVTLTTVDAAGSEQDLLLKVQGGATPNWGSGVIEVFYNAPTNSVMVATFRPSTLQWFNYPGIPVTFANGDQFGAQALATGQVVILKNGVEVGRVTLNAADQAFFNSKGGYIGLWFINATNAFFDDFGGGNVVP